MVKRFFQIAFAFLILSSLYLSLSPISSGVPQVWNDKLIHCISYFAVIMTMDFSWRTGKALLTKAILVLVYSSLIEYGQSFIPGREMSLGDVITNASGIILFLLIVPLLKSSGTYEKLKLS